ncbi:sialoadhesin-like isoform X2 [Hemibagrus wyckioides]|uniref:sialoadhesin-like isoform X2 n=1 Tax=Hemibagrus wyckioides TaxID=337641 RepID=UPI00266B6139|nr:sialoadhesin-like isoform X2 [Hemibagrus wyckioides]
MLIRKRTFSAAATLMLMLSGVLANPSVTLHLQSLCAVTGSTVKIPCSYSKAYSVKQKQWYRAQRFKGLPQDLRKDPEYSGRVFVNTWWSDCELTVKNVRVSDSGVYNFRIKTQSSWISASSGVQLTVTGLKVTVSGQYNWKKLSCATTCSLSNKPIYIWYKNGQRVSEQYINELGVSSWEAGSYSCAVKGHEELRSPAVCVFDKSCWSVTYSTQTICSLIGSSVDIHSYYTFPNNYQVTKVEWFINELEDVREDEEYQGRVQYTNSSQNDCSLRITDLRERDAQTYRFRFHTDRVTHTGESGVTLSVTGLKVTVSGQYNWKKLSCATTCSLSNKPIYIWYKNGQRVSEQYINELDVSSWEAGSYSCAVKGHEELRSPAVCVFDKSCWSVTYSTQTVCSLIGSSVDIHSYYTFPNNYQVTKVVWFINELEDVREDVEYQGRVQYTNSSQNDCSLRITDLRERDAQTYRFKFYTDRVTHTGESGVTLSVTGLQVTVSDWYNGYKKLNCITTCTLSNNPTYIWYKNGQRVTDQYRNELYFLSNDAGSYSCAVRGHEALHSPAVYSPKNTSAVVLPSGDTVEGDSVTLSCSSDANPPVLTYSWFKKSAAADTRLTTGQDYSISNISSQDSGLYYCTADNQLGHHTSTPVHLDVLYPPKNTRAVVLSSGDILEGASVTLSCSSDANPPVLTYSWFKQSAAADTMLTTGQDYSISNISSQDSGLYYCTACNKPGHHNSTPVHLDVLYPPRNLSVTVISSMSGDMGTLLCRSDSNPNSSYTWYRKTKGGVILVGNGTNLTLSSRENGFHYCTAKNGFGSSSSSEWAYTSGSRTMKYVASGFTLALVLSFIAVILWMRKRAPVLRTRSEEYSKNDSAPVYSNVSAMTSDPTQTASSEDQDTVQYSSVFFRHSHTQEVPLYSTVQLPKSLSEEQEVEYATVSLVKSRAVREDKIYNNVEIQEIRRV